MPVLVAGKPLRSKLPTLLVENKLEPGEYVFRLVVIDDEANASVPADLVVTVVDASTRIVRN